MTGNQRHSEQKIALITGASRGLGKVISSEFARKGYCLALNFQKSEQHASKLLSEIHDMGAQAAVFKADVSDHLAVQEMIGSILDKWGAVDIVVQNAAIANDSLLHAMTEKQWDEVLSVNLKGIYNISQAVLPAMIRQKQGSLIAITSYVGFTGSFGAANYAASKAAVIGVTKSLAKEYGKRGLRVNAVCPGFMLTDMGLDVPEKYREAVKKQNVLNRLNNPEEVARFIVHLANMKNVSGQVFNLDSRIVP